MSTNAHPAHLTGAYGPASYLGNTLSACQACHPYPNGHANGTVDVLNGAGSGCVGCHAGSPPAWGSTSRIACTVCHAAAPAVLPNGVSAPFKGNFAAAGHGRFAASNQCTACHDADSAHISGTLGDATRLYLPDNNTQCASCHDNTTAQQMSTHVLDKNETPTPSLCNSCHDPHGTTNAFMIRTVINGVAITFTDTNTGFVQTSAPYQGLCQVCHTLTNHYRAGQAPDGHPTANCLSCHSHNGPYAFKPSGNCDSCHGYPPAPRNPALTFGTYENWANARFEDYSGGGGAHLVAQHISPSAKPSEGWANCAICHNSGKTDSAPYHQMVMPVSNHISNVTVAVDPQYRFSNSFTIYTGAKLLNPPASNATGSCYNISCHMSPSPRWSIER
jgi:predicted CXXCH cytochrome family protein